jgi:hypothetical protein
MGNSKVTQVFDGELRKPKVFNVYHVYYIDRIIGHLYVADRTFKTDDCVEVIDKETFYLIKENFGDGVIRCLKGFKTKDDALKAMENIKTGVYNVEDDRSFLMTRFSEIN